ncbi:MAG: 3-keto-disaccharide hydrolase [Vicinamibacteraceae bacterium]
MSTVQRAFVVPVMSLLAVLVAALASVSPLAQGIVRLSDFRDPEVTYDEGWTVLFNGKDFTGWVPVLQNPDKTFRKYLETEVHEQSTFYIRDGVLFATGTPSGYLRTSGVYDNYVFHVETRFSLEPGNSGVLTHIRIDGVWPESGAIEAQLYQPHMGRIYPILPATLDGGEMFHFVANPPGEWNTLEVYSEEGRVATVLNGKLVGLAANAVPRSGYIGLQSAADIPVEFRNIKIRRHTPSYYLRPRTN